VQSAELLQNLQKLLFITLNHFSSILTILEISFETKQDSM